MQYINLTRGYVAIVDDVDYPILSQYKWHANPNTCSKDKVYAIRVQGKGEYKNYPDRKNISMHSMVIACPDGFHIDHINGSGIDNRRSNLRISTRHENMANQKQHRDSRSPFKGVWWSPSCNKWAAQIACKGKKFYLGVFQKAEDAARAYDAKARELFGFFAKTNFPAVPQ